MLRKHSNSLDVAKLAGVSQTTVSFVLNQRRGHSISAETRERVLKAAEQLQYRSNRLSNGVLRGNTRLIGVVSPLISDDYYAHILSSVSLGCISADETVIFSPAHESIVRPNPLISLIEYRVEGIIVVCQSAMTDLSEWIDEIIAKGVRCVIVDDRKYEKHVHCVVSDDIAGARSVTRALIDLGHTRIAHLSAGDKATTAIDRRVGFIEEMRSIGQHQSDLMIEGTSYSAEDGRAAVKVLLSSPNKPTAIFAANDRLAAEAIKELTVRGLRCPQDVSVVGYGNTQIARALDLTSVDQQPEAIGMAAVKSLHHQKSGLSEVQPTTVFGCRLIERASTGPCNA